MHNSKGIFLDFFRSKSDVMAPMDHLEELRMRIIYSLSIAAIFISVAFFYSDRLLTLLTRSVPTLVILSPAEGFMVHLKIAVVAGVAIAAPFILHQVLLFFLPALKGNEKSAMIWIIPMAFVFFFSGASFSLFVLLPFAIKFFLSYTNDKVHEMISLSSYVGFVLSFLVAGGVVFELPLVMMGLGKIGIVSSLFLRRHRKEAVLVILIATALLSPSPEVFSWLMLAGSMYFLFELSIMLVKFVEKKI